MQARIWIEQLRDQLLATENDLRRLVRQHHYNPPPIGTALYTPGAVGGRSIVIGLHEARTLLRAAMPVPMTARHKRQAHAALVATLASFASQLLDLNDTHAGPQAIAGALDLVDTLRAWMERMRWHQATTKAGASWPAQPSVTTVMRQSTPACDPGLFDLPAAAIAATVPRTDKRTRVYKARKPAAVQPSMLLPLPGKPPRPAEARPPAAAVRRRAG